MHFKTFKKLFHPPLKFLSHTGGNRSAFVSSVEETHGYLTLEIWLHFNFPQLIPKLLTVLSCSHPHPKGQLVKAQLFSSSSTSTQTMNTHAALLTLSLFSDSPYPCSGKHWVVCKPSPSLGAVNVWVACFLTFILEVGSRTSHSPLGGGLATLRNSSFSFSHPNLFIEVKGWCWAMINNSNRANSAPNPYL